ncbi:hypothetical protein GCM10011331_22590 [Flavimobilis marinus]|uniref:Ig-like domain (Group 3) n=1 Tax=Flavimobilis marinus TaxID=285351 RepID=A0A1I2GPP8_9MICO|nr:Ig-like domain-containing protein [Flavimobilis marinus]GHG55717.1 hypothetical protein GCM10011331_22590 [Flavimobilis marinus]SFF19575.1 Ig-like domain (group 3) [Flavimobilis marinus]
MRTKFLSALTALALAGVGLAAPAAAAPAPTAIATVSYAGAVSTVSAKAVATTYGKGAKLIVSVKADGLAAKNVTGKVTFSVRGFAQTKSVKNGIARFNLPRLGAGTYAVNVSYAGNASIKASSTTVRYTVGKAKSKIKSKVVVKRGAKARVAVNLNNSSATGKVTVKISKKGKYSVTRTVTLKKGKGVVTLPATKAKGKYSVKIVYKGSSNVQGSTVKTKVTVK